jgi:hypothetical protein
VVQLNIFLDLFLGRLLENEIFLYPYFFRLLLKIYFREKISWVVLLTRPEPEGQIKLNPAHNFASKLESSGGFYWLWLQQASR